MIDVTPYKQSPGYCGPACLKMALSVYGIELSEDELAERTLASRDEGCKEVNMVKVAEELGLKAYVKQNSNMEELRGLVDKGIPVIVDWNSPEEGGHYSVVVGFDGDEMLMADPHFGEVVRHTISWFEDRWHDEVYGQKLLKEIIVVYR